MPAVWACLRNDLRRRWRGWLVLALLVGLTASVVLAAASAARRTQTAFPRLLAASKAPDVLVTPQNYAFGGFDAELSRLPGVAQLGELAGMPLIRLDESGRPDDRLVGPAASVDGRAAYTIDRPKLLSGRLPRVDQEFEVLASKDEATLLHLRVGSHLTMAALSPAENQNSTWDPGTDHARYTFTVVGIGVLPEDAAGSEDTRVTGLLLSPAWYRGHGDPANLAFSGAWVRLRPGTDVARFRHQAEEVAARHPEAGALFFATYADRYAAVARAIRPQTAALALFAALLGASGLVVVGQAVARHVVLGAGEHPTLHALGMTRGQLMATALVPTVGIGVAGAALAVVAAPLLAPLVLLGPARVAEPHPGIAVNLALLGLGGAAIVSLLGAWVVLPAWRVARVAGSGPAAMEPAGPIRSSHLADAAARGGFPPVATVGLRMALEPGRGRTAVPVRGALVGTGAAIAALVTASLFAVDLGQLVSTPRMYGRTWDFVGDAGFATVPDQAMAAVTSIPGVAAWAVGDYGNVTLGGRAVPAVGIDTRRGSVFPTLLEGRPPLADDEVVLGTKTLRRLHRSVGQRVAVEIGDRSPIMRIVGRAVFPALGRGSFAPTGLGEGAAVTAEALAPPDLAPGTYNFLLLRFSGGSDRRAVSAAVARVANDAGCPPSNCSGVREAQRPVDIAGYDRMRWTPIALAGVLGALAAAMLGHVLVTSVRRRRRDLAVLKTLGFVRRQVSAAVVCQATALVGLALLVGLPVGVAAGRWAWGLFARQLGIGPTSAIPGLLVAGVVAATLVVANLVAAVPARIASRTRPALVLRSE